MSFFSALLLGLFRGLLDGLFGRRHHHHSWSGYDSGYSDDGSSGYDDYSSCDDDGSLDDSSWDDSCDGESWDDSASYDDGDQ